MTINAMDMNTMVNIVRDAFEGQDRHNPQLNPAFEIVHFLLSQASEKITKTIFSFLPQPDRNSWLNMEMQFSEKLQLHIMAIGDNSGTSEAAPTNRMTCLADYLFKTIVDSWASTRNFSAKYLLSKMVTSDFADSMNSWWGVLCVNFPFHSFVNCSRCTPLV